MRLSGARHGRSARRRVGAAALAVLLAGCSSTVVAGHPHAVPAGSPHASPTAGPAGSSGPPPAAHLTDPTDARGVEAGVRADLRAVDSYSSGSLARDERTASAHATGPFARHYRTTFERVVEPQARKGRVSQSARVEAVGLVSVGARSARAIALLRLTFTRGSAAPRPADEQTRVSLRRVGGRWLLSGQSLVRPGKGPVIPSFRVPVGNLGLTEATAGAATGVQDLLTLRRAHFARDYARAEGDATGTERRTLVANAATVRHALVSQGVDTLGIVVDSGPETVAASGRSATFLVFATSQAYSSPSDRHTPVPRALDVTVVQIGSRWLISASRTL